MLLQFYLLLINYFFINNQIEAHFIKLYKVYYDRKERKNYQNVGAKLR